MNKKVIKVMIGLVIAFLISDYILKFFFPQEFVMLIENENIVAIGAFIDARPWLTEICDIIFTFISYWLYLGAVTQKWSLNWKEVILVFIAIIISHTAYYFDPTITATVSVIAMLGIPAISNAKLRPVILVYTTHYLAQYLSISIRNLPMLLTNVNYATILLMAFESYFWLLLFYLYYNMKKEEKL